MSAVDSSCSFPLSTPGFTPPLKTSCIDTPLGEMLAITDEKALYLLEFSNWRGLDSTVQKLCTKTGRDLISGDTPITNLVKGELAAYFEGNLHSFQTPLCPLGTPFQKEAWEALKKVPYGETRSYRDQASA